MRFRTQPIPKIASCAQTRCPDAVAQITACFDGEYLLPVYTSLDFKVGVDQDALAEFKDMPDVARAVED
eukprot:6630843-Pyramimonas_sp.AAC.1